MRAWWQGVRQQWCETTSIGFVTDRPFLPPARLVAMSVMQGGFYQQYWEEIHICMIFLGKDLMVLLLWHWLVTSHMLAQYNSDILYWPSSSTVCGAFLQIVTSYKLYCQSWRSSTTRSGDNFQAGTKLLLPLLRSSLTSIAKSFFLCFLGSKVWLSPKLVSAKDDWFWHFPTPEPQFHVVSVWCWRQS